MNLIVDIGNTVAKIAVFDGQDMLEQVYDSNDTLSRLFEMFNRYNPDHVAIITVVDMTEEVRKQLKKLPIPVLVVDHTTPLPVSVSYKTPNTLGYDRVAAVVGAYDRFPDRNILVIDSGTCITYEFINSKGEYLGGNISLGATMRLRALNAFTGHLPLVDSKGEELDFGVDTDTAIRAGVLKGIEYEMIGYIKSMQKKYSDLIIFMTGGKRFSFENNLKSSIFIDKFLVLRGLNCILNYNITLNL